jgi:glycosyltransferase involved in cell wall biosynthesis
MNTAFEHADGELLAMIGDDDRWSDPEKLEKQVRALEESDRENVGIVCTGWRVVSEDTGEVKEERSPRRPANLPRHILGQNQIIQSIGAVVTRDAWEAVGGTDEDIPRGIDSDLFRRMILDGYDVLFLDEPMIEIYVDRQDRMTAKQRPEDIWSHIEGERVKLEKFPEAFDEYPAARARVLEKIGTHFVRLYRSTREDEHLRKARQHFRESLSYNPFHWKAVVRYLWSLGVQLEPAVR